MALDGTVASGAIPASAVKRPELSAKKKRVHTAKKDVLNGCTLKQTDRGRIFLSQKDTSVLVVEGTPASFCVATYEGTPKEKGKQASGQFVVKSTLTVTPGGQFDGQAVYILLDVLKRAASDNCMPTAAGRRRDGCLRFLCVALQLFYKPSQGENPYREYKVESYKAGGQHRVLQTLCGVTALQPNQPISVKAFVHGDVISVEINDHPVTESLHIGRSPRIPFGSVQTHGIGVAVYGKTRALVSKFGFTSEIPDLTGAGLHPQLEKWITEGAVNVNEVQRGRCETLSHLEEENALFSLIERDIVRSTLCVRFEEIAALESAKKLLKEAVVLPCVLPDLFTGIREPWRGVLLFGPPGTGKTMLAKAVASTAQCCFFNCSVATLTSKWRGESEKLVRALFEMARSRSPSVLFFDEVDSLMSRRASGDEHEASRRFKSELLTQLDGLFTVSKASDLAKEKRDTNLPGEDADARDETRTQQAQPHVTVLAATNCPWDLDEAFRRRLEKRIYTPLPDCGSRKEMLSSFLRDIETSGDLDVSEIASRTEGYSGADVYLVCKEACMNPMRRLLATFDVEEIKRKRATGTLGEEETQVRMEDFLTALHASNPSTSPAEIGKYEEWNKQYGTY